MKLLKTNNIGLDIVKYSQDQFGFKLPNGLSAIPNHTVKLMKNQTLVQKRRPKELFEI